ncbi:hypothetical protein LTS18_004905 [Coniosporium uncinatum]|uniref:Uncharacterized protein n=1 Tax=Coniosporium uncinatum TaxID=93489 RepID=A0ACC3DB62_9PEZI|nr:hypothetical protein LTS18_004905 [Coniosporium uncinatum]
MPRLRGKALNGLDSVKSIVGNKAETRTGYVPSQLSRRKPGEYDALRSMLLKDWEVKQWQLIELARETLETEDSRRAQVSRRRFASMVAGEANTLASESAKDWPAGNLSNERDITRDRTIQHYLQLADGLTCDSIIQLAGLAETNQLHAVKEKAAPGLLNLLDPSTGAPEPGTMERHNTRRDLGHAYTDRVEFYRSVADDVRKDPVVQSARATVKRVQKSLDHMRGGSRVLLCDTQKKAKRMVEQVNQLAEKGAAEQMPKKSLRRKKNNPFFALSGIEGLER